MKDLKIIDAKSQKNLKDIKHLLEKTLKDIKEMPRTPELFESREFPILLHKKEVFSRVLDILNNSNLSE